MSSKNKVIIGLVGPKTCGKSTVVNILAEFYPIQESALADRLKNVICEVLDLQRVQLDRQDLKEVDFQEPKELTKEVISKVLEKFGVNPNSYKDPILMQTYLESYRSLVGIKLRSPREAAQIIGSEVLRSVDQDIHCKNVRISDSVFTVVSDVRFFNEYLYFNNLRNVTFIPLYIQRDLAGQKVTSESHVSEKDFLKFRDRCIKIDNNGYLTDTEIQIKASIDKILYGGK
jgi:energy-coupling factor transporter ATP-binding protein EcfA2